MVRSSSPPGWWRSGRIWWRLLCLGAILGAAGAFVIQMGALVSHLSPNNAAWSLAFLIIEIPILAILGTAVAGVVILARLLVPVTAPRNARVVVTGAMAFVGSGTLTLALFNAFPFGVNSWAVAAATGIVAGVSFAVVSCRHVSEV